MLFKLALLTLAITATLSQNEFDACNSGAGVQGYDFTVDYTAGTVTKGTTLSCKNYDAQECQANFGGLAADAAQTAATATSDIVSYCNINGADLEVNVQQFAWNEGGHECQYAYVFRGGNVPTLAISDSQANLDAWIGHANTGVIVDPLQDNHEHTAAGATFTGQRFQKKYSIASIVDGSSVIFTEQASSDATQFVFKAQFSYSIFSNAVEQYMYAFDVELTINRETSAVNQLTVTKTLVAGQCCKNSLGAESELRFCPADTQWCDASSEITTIARNTDFYVQHYLDLTDTDTNTLSAIYNLYPDEIKIGPFFPVWSTTDSAWFDASGTIVGNSILIKSNVAFAASVSVASRLWAKSNTLPHTCFYTGSAYESAGSACTSGAATRRFLQATKSGAADTQMSAAKGLVFSDDGSNNQTPTNNNKKSDDDDNTVLIAVVVSLVVVLAIGGIVGGIYYCKSKNQKQENNYNNDVKNVQQQQQA